MPPLGAHFSVAGGLTNAVATAARLKCPTLQLFTKNASQWAAKPLAEAEVAAFRAAAADAGVGRMAAHDSYLINLAAPGDELFAKSVNAMAVEIERAEQLGLSYLVTHPGAHVGSGDEAGLRRVTAGLDEALRRTRGAKVTVLLETTAGQGSSLGWRFEHLGRLLKDSAEPERLAVCFDTCHAFAAGYGLGTAAEYADTFGHFDSSVGLGRLALFHVNDSVKPLGSRVDRHAGLGLGQIGAAAFRRLVADPRFADTPMILETPKEDDAGREMDAVHLKMLRRWSKAGPAKE